MLNQERTKEERERAEAIAGDLLSIGAVFFSPSEPFTWASGIKSPIYCDNRLILTAPSVRTHVEGELKKMIEEAFPEAELLMGTATAGIAHAAITGHLMGLPMGYVRSKAKDHGRKNQIEGRLLPGEKVVVIEDLVSTGGSVLDACSAIKEAGGEVLGVASIFTYGLSESRKAFLEEGIPLFSLSDFDAAVSVGLNKGILSKQDANKLKDFQKNPRDPSWMGKK